MLSLSEMFCNLTCLALAKLQNCVFNLWVLKLWILSMKVFICMYQCMSVYTKCPFFIQINFHCFPNAYFLYQLYSFIDKNISQDKLIYMYMCDIISKYDFIHYYFFMIFLYVQVTFTKCMTASIWKLKCLNKKYTCSLMLSKKWKKENETIITCLKSNSKICQRWLKNLI